MLAQLLFRYGYLAVFLGTLLEGETVLVLGGYAAHRGYLQLPLVILLAFLGSLIGDQAAFFLGRRYGTGWVARRATWQPRIARVEALFARRRYALMFGFRFVYGLRNLTPFTLGMIGVSPRTFAPLNALGAAVWALVVGVAGWTFGHGLEVVVERAHRIEGWVFAGGLSLGGALWLLRQLRSRRSEPQRKDPAS